MSIMKKILFFLKPFIYIIRYVGEGDNVLLFRGCNSKNARYTRWLKILFMAGHFSHYAVTGYVYVCAADTLSASATISAAHT